MEFGRRVSLNRRLSRSARTQKDPADADWDAGDSTAAPAQAERIRSGPSITVRRQTRGVTVVKALKARQKSLIEE
jgi:hypothetical protein